jgi:WD40 repeat protein
LNPKVTDVHQTLAYRRGEIASWMLLIGTVFMLIGAYGVFFDELSGDDRRRPAALFIMVLGGFITVFQLHEFLIPGKPLLELSPEGLLVRIEWITEFLIPWHEVHGIDTAHVTAQVRKGALVHAKSSTVTVVLVPRRYYDRFISIPVLLRGPAWSSFFIPKGTMMQVALHHDGLPVAPEELRAAVEARWHAFKERPAQLSPGAEQRQKASLRVAWVVPTILVVGIPVAYIVTSPRLWTLFAESDDARWTRLEREQVERGRRFKQVEEDTRRVLEKTGEGLRRNGPGWFDDDGDARARDKLASAPAEPTVASEPQGPPRPHSDSIAALAVTPDGRSFLSAGSDRAVKLWDVGDPRAFRDIGVHKGIVRSVFALPGGAHALSAGDDGEIVLRALADGRVAHVFEAREHGAVRALAVSRDGRRAVSVHQGGAGLVWDIENKLLLRVLADAGMRQNAVAISPDGAHAIGGGVDGLLRLWDINTGSLLRTFGGHRAVVYGVAYSPDGQHVISGGGDSALVLWSPQTGTQLRNFSGHTDAVYAVAVAADGTRILSGSTDATARLWDFASARELMKFTGHAGAIYAVTFAPDGAILTGSADRTIRLWRPNGQAVRVFPTAQARR